MKYIVQATLKPGSKNGLAEAFEKQGPNRNPGVKFLGAWIGQRSDVAFALVEGEQESLVAAACESWSAREPA